MNRSSTRIQNLTLGGIMVALATVLSFLKAFDLPYGGSVTLCSMLPIMFYGYRCGPKWGVAAGFVFSVLQLLFGLDDLKGISALMVVGSILLDYLAAFTVLGLAGMFRGRLKRDSAAFTLGCLVTGLLRYACSFLSGWLLWAQFMSMGDMQDFIALFIPGLAGASGTALAVAYSLIYNGSYMLPEILLTCVVGFLLVQFAGKQVLGKAAGANR